MIRLLAVRRGGRSMVIDACLVGWLAATLLALAAPGGAQIRFRVTHDVKSRDARGIVLEGRVVNETDRDVVDVWVTAEAVNASGKVLARGIAFVGSTLARGESVPFEAKLPSVDGVERFRVSVTSYRAAIEAQSP